MNLSLPTWLVDWLGMEMPGGNDVVWRLESTWDWAPWLTVLFALLAAVWIVWLYFHESTSARTGYLGLLAALRLAAIGVLMVMLAEFVLTAKRTAPPPLAIIVDRSASMTTIDHYDDSDFRRRLGQRLADLGLNEATRLNLAKLVLTQDDAQDLRDLAKNYDVSVYFAAAGLQKQAGNVDELATTIAQLSANGAQSQLSRLGDAIRRVLRESTGAAPAAIVLVSDGITTDGPTIYDVAQEARRRVVPLIALGLGSDAPPQDVEIADVLVDDVVFVDDLIGVQASIKSTGLAGKQAQVLLHADGQTDPVASESVTLGASGESQSVYLLHRATEPGDVQYVLEVTVDGEETNTQNNRQRFVVSVRDQKIRVLLAGGYPNYEFRYLKSLLDRDSTIELSAYQQDADLRFVEQDRSAIRSFPLGEQALLDYDVVILCDLDPRLLPRSAWHDLLAVVSRQGRGLVMIAGPRFLPWDYGQIPEALTLLPIASEALMSAQPNRASNLGYRPQPTPLGLRTASFQLGDSLDETRRIWQELSPLYWLVQIDHLKPAAQVLAEDPTRSGPTGRSLPVISQQFVGNGRVLFHATDETWRWRFRVGDAFFARYWLQTIRYLARGTISSREGVELSVDRREYDPGEPVRLRARFLGAPPTDGANVTVLLESARGRRKTVSLRPLGDLPDSYEAVVSDLQPDQYEVLLVEPPSSGDAAKTAFSIVRPPTEMERLEMNRAELSTAAELSRGKFYTIDEADRLFAELPRGRRIPVEDLPPVSLWNRWWMLLLFLSLVTTEWILRKRGGMM